LALQRNAALTGGQGFALHLDEEVHNALACCDGDVDLCSRTFVGLDNAVISGHVGTHFIGNRPDRAIILGSGDLKPGRDGILGFEQVTVGRGQRLQGNHGTIIGVDTIVHYELDQFLPEKPTFYGPRSFERGLS
jgi:hypothetical protein